MSVKIEKKSPKKTHRAVSEYGRSRDNSKQPIIGFDNLPLGVTYDHRGYPSVQGRFQRIPTKLIRIATVTLSARTKPAPRAPMTSLYYEEPKKPQKVIGWDDANNARPPLRIDMEGPGPCTYSPVNKPLNETNAPSWSFGIKTQPDKDGGARKSWEKSWFQTPHLYQQKTDFFSDTSWPTPNTYSQRPLLGPRQITYSEAPSFTIGKRKNFEMAKPGANKQPSPNDYERDSADKVIMPKGPSYSHQFRREGTVLWSFSEKTPGPAAYSPSYSYSKNAKPSFTIRNLRREKSHVLGPFSTF
ncbi:hypothetical protein FSP39_001775 [Pinctada imbricata]|uniref:Uncharacterized protein n=1 Tax=Pinctada imbricata TaxID=66713 RepID=A0AA89BY81_PINIB|nr:hypothetical protein FSP39_001775 [Pinctada imbricata]